MSCTVIKIQRRQTNLVLRLVGSTGRHSTPISTVLAYLEVCCVGFQEVAIQGPTYLRKLKASGYITVVTVVLDVTTTAASVLNSEVEGKEVNPD